MVRQTNRECEAINCIPVKMLFLERTPSPKQTNMTQHHFKPPEMGYFQSIKPAQYPPSRNRPKEVVEEKEPWNPTCPPTAVEQSIEPKQKNLHKKLRKHNRFLKTKEHRILQQYQGRLLSTSNVISRVGKDADRILKALEKTVRPPYRDSVRKKV